MNSRSTSTPGQRTRWWGKTALLGAALALGGAQMSAQVATTYTFGQAAGTFTPLSGGTVIPQTLVSVSPFTAPGMMDDVIYNVPNGTLPFTFTFDGTGYTGFNISANGFITFGATAPLGNSYTPLSATTAYAGAIAGWGRDVQGGYAFVGSISTGSNMVTNVTGINGVAVGEEIVGTGIPAGTTITGVAGTPPTATITMSANATATNAAAALGCLSGEIRYGVDPATVAPNRVFVIQFLNFKPFGSGGTSPALVTDDFQIKLYETSNNVQVVYGNCVGNTTSNTGQVGLRGPNNTFATNVNNRLVTTTCACDWATSVVGTSNTSSCRLSTTAPAQAPAAGLTYTWTAPLPPACPTPGGTALAPTGGTTADLSWSCPSCTGTFIVEYGPAGYTPGTGATAGAGGTLVTITGVSPQAITGLPNNSTSDVYVRQDCGINGFGANGTVRKFIPGDVCANAIDLGSLVSPLSSTTVGATSDYSNACNTNSDPDLVYFISVPDGGTLTIGQTVNGYDSEHYVFFGGSCPFGGTQLACIDDPDIGNVVWTNTTGVAQTVYWVQDGFNAGNSGTFTLAWNLVVPPPCAGAPNAGTATPASNTLCAGATQAMSSNAVNNASGVSYQWQVSSVSGGPYSDVVGGTGATTLNYTTAALSAGTFYYVLRARCANEIIPTGDSYSNEVVLTVNPLPTATITPSGPTTLCTPNTVDLQSSVGDSYLWSPGGATTQTITVSASGSYTVQVTTAGCSATSSATVVTVNTSPTITSVTATPSVICPGDPSQLQVSVTTPATYCNTVAFTNVESISNVTFSDINNSSTCGIGGAGYQDFTAVIGNVVAGNVYPITVSGTTDGNFVNYFTAFFDWNQDGVFEASQQIGFISNTACVATATNNVTVPPGALNGTTRMRIVKDWVTGAAQAPPSVNYPANPCGTYDFGQAEDYTLSVTGGASPYTYSWNNAGSLNDATIAGPIATPTVTTSYVVTVTAANGCTDVDSVEVTMDPTDTDNDGITDCLDDCPTTPGVIGSPCNDGNPFTSGDVLQNDCSCAGTPVPCDNFTLAFNFGGGNGSETTWQIVDANSPFVLASGGPYANPTASQAVCIPQGACFRLTVNDSGNDGLAADADWTITDNNGRVLVDNTNNGACFTSNSTTGSPWCNEPASGQTVIPGHCGKLNWISTDVIIASASPAVSAEWGIGDQTDDGYQFWFENPCGGYTRKITRTHATSGGNGPANAIRASKLKLSSMVTNPLPVGTLLNVRVRTLVNGDFGAWGPACQFKLDPNACTLTKLNDTPSDPHLSCGVSGKVVGVGGDNGKLFAKIVTSGGNPATNYRFEFSVVGEGYLRNANSTSGVLVLGVWVTNPLLCGTYTYDVRVQASFDGGATYCPYGDVCTVEITNNQALPNCTTPGNAFGSERIGADVAEVDFAMYPNPNRGEQLTLQFSGFAEAVEIVSMDVFDGMGKRVATRTFSVQDGSMNRTVDLGADMAPGLYVVQLTAGETIRTERLVIQR